MTTIVQAAPAPRDLGQHSLGTELGRVLDGRLAALRAAARARFPAAGMHRDPDQSVEVAREWTLLRLQQLQQAGCGAIGLPTGAEEAEDPAAVVVNFELLAHGDLSVLIKSGVQFGLFGGAINSLGTAWHRDRYLGEIAELQTLGCYAMTELGHGSDVAGLETTITYVPASDAFEVHTPTRAATKAYLGNAARDGALAVVFGQLLAEGRSYGVHATIVPIRGADGSALPGVTIGDHGAKGGLPGVDNGTLRFDRVRVPRELLLDRFGGIDAEGRYRSSIQDPKRRFFTMLGTLVRGRVCIAAAAGVAARRGLAIATGYALQRRQFTAPGHAAGVLLLDYRSQQLRLLPAVARAYALGFAQNELVAELARVQRSGTSEQQRKLQRSAAGLKALATSFANHTLQECREACGGAGYLSENRLVGLRADADVFTTFEGDNTVLLQLVGRELLGEFRQRWRELDRLGQAQLVARNLSGVMVERTAAGLAADRLAALARRSGEDQLLSSRARQLSLFREREEHTLESLVRRSRRAGSDLASTNRLSSHLLFLARAHLERTLLESFIAAIEPLPEGQLRTVLEQLCSLFALSSIEADRAWFLEHHRILARQAKSIGALQASLCGELRPVARDLVAGFGIPSDWLGAACLTDHSGMRVGDPTQPG